MKHSAKWYNTRLQRYFDKYYKAYEETAEFYTNPAQNKWKFNIPELGIIVLLTCNDHGTVTKVRTKNLTFGCDQL